MSDFGSASGKSAGVRGGEIVRDAGPYGNVHILTLANVTPEFRREARWIRSTTSDDVMEIARWIDDNTVEVRRASSGPSEVR